MKYYVKSSECGFMLNKEDGFIYDEVWDINNPRAAIFNNKKFAMGLCDFEDESVIDEKYNYLFSGNQQIKQEV